MYDYFFSMNWFNSYVLSALIFGLWIGYSFGVQRGARHGTRDQNRFQFDKLNGQINRLSYSARAEIENDLRQGNKISAIKTFRAETNVGLKEAKDAVEHMMRTNS